MKTRGTRRALGALSIAMLAALAACGDDDDSPAQDPTSTSSAPATDASPSSAPATNAPASSAPTTAAGDAPTTSAATTAASEPAADGEAELQALIDAATEEGSVTLYSSQLPTGLEALAAGFEERFPGIDVEAIRQLDTDMFTKLGAEQENGIADMYVSAAEPSVRQLAAEGYHVPATALQFEEAFDASLVDDGDFFEVGSAVLVPTWNTELVPDGIDDYEDLLDPALAGGQIGLPEPVASSFVDMYLYLEEHLGADALEALAAQEPRMYASTTAAGQAVVSGEIAVAAFAPPPILDKEKGAPVDFFVPEDVWGARYYGAVLAAAPHPNAAQLLAYYMVTPEGQELVQANFGSIYEDIPGTLASNANVRHMDIDLLTPEFVDDFSKRWAELIG